MATIKAIEGNAVHQIQSGQVIVDLNSVVKELVENSLDAGASSIEIRFKNQGLDSIEVQDNGKGIAPEDFETVALKHHTSKLSSYEDLTSLHTFGFRGEALSSLCALSHFHVVTARAEDGAVGKRLEFEVSGQLTGTSVRSAQPGTTVSVEDLFCNLPVRRKDLEKNIKREYGKVVNLLHAYACISTGVRFAVSNQMPKGKKVVVFSTKSNTTTKENIVNVYGAKTLVALLKLDLHIGMEPCKGPSTQGARNWSTQATDRSMEVVVQGHISKPIFGEGRQTPDRQMFFVNSRPCQLPQVSKAINEVYKSFNVTQSPFIFANLVMDTESYDVNVSPDKRTILLHDQTALLESLKAALTTLFEQTDHTMPQSQLPTRKLPSYQPLTVTKRASAGLDISVDHEDSDSEASEADVKRLAPRVLLSQQRLESNAAGTPPSLIHNWVGRDSDARKETRGLKKVLPSVSSDKQEPSFQKQQHCPEDTDRGIEIPAQLDKFVSPLEQDNSILDLKHEGASGPSMPTYDIENDTPLDTDNLMSPAQEPNPHSTCYNDLFPERPAHLSARDDSAAPTSAVNEASSVARGEEEEEEGEDSRMQRAEPAICATTPGSQKAVAGPVQNAFDRVRPKRTSQQTAEITVGDTTTTTVIGGSPPYKRRRVHKPADSQSIANFGASPLLARGLRNFAAPGSQMAAASSALPAAAQRELPGSESDSSDEASDCAEQQEAQAEFSHGIVSDQIQDEVRTSDPLDELGPGPMDDDDFDHDYVDVREKKIQEDEEIARLIQEAEDAVARPTDANLRRASQVLKNGGSRREMTLQLDCYLDSSIASISKQIDMFRADMQYEEQIVHEDGAVVKSELDDNDAERTLSLTVNKTDFERMVIIGQFNLGFILALRPASSNQDRDELFIVDQHAADEKYNYERLQRTVTLQNQRLVRPKPLELTAIEEEVILDNPDALKANGFEIDATSDVTDDDSTRRRCRLVALPMSGEKTFDLSDLEELLHLLSETPSGSTEVPRPRKVQRMLAMRACRSSIMVGKTLTLKQMQKVVRHMGEMEKPWNCPHGRPTMRHLASLAAWRGWQEGNVLDTDEIVDDDLLQGRHTDWKSWLARRR